jgi:hypothetical protein
VSIAKVRSKNNHTHLHLCIWYLEEHKILHCSSEAPEANEEHNETNKTQPPIHFPPQFHLLGSLKLRRGKVYRCQRNDHHRNTNNAPNQGVCCQRQVVCVLMKEKLIAEMSSKHSLVN